MRDILLILAALGFLPLCFRYPAVGVICWTWFSLMAPHRLVYGIAYGQQFNLLIAAVTLAGWLLSTERKRWTPDLVPKLLLLFVLWMTLNTWLSPFPDNAWFYWEQTVRSWALVFLVLCITTTKVRVHALVWVLVIALGFYGVKGGIFTILTGGHFAVFGPGGSIIADNNQLALAIVMILPLVNYLRLHTQSRPMRLGLGAALALQVAMVLGSQSRGAAIALVAVFGSFWLTTQRKLVYAIVGIAVFGAALSLMPDAYFDRLNTITNAEADNSFMGRVTAWHVAVNVARDWFPLGVGFSVPRLSPIFGMYFPGERIRAAHSIYFEVIGDQGFIGFGIYLAILVLALRNCHLILRQTRGNPVLLWAFDLAKMMRIGFIGYAVGGAALSMAYFDGFILLIALTSCLREITTPERFAEQSGIRLGTHQVGMRAGPVGVVIR